MIKNNEQKNCELKAKLLLMLQIKVRIKLQIKLQFRTTKNALATKFAPIFNSILKL